MGTAPGRAAAQVSGFPEVHMNALALAVLLLAEPPAHGLADVAPPAEGQRLELGTGAIRSLAIPQPIVDADERPVIGTFRVTLGGSGVSGLSGVSPTVLVGVEVKPFRHVGFRGGMGMVTAAGGGAWASAELSAAVVYHLGLSTFADPYVSVGAQAGVVSLYRPAYGQQAISFATSTGDPIPPPPDSAAGRGPVNAYAAPELQIGVNTALRGRVSLDVGVRYLPLTYKGETRNAFTGLFTLCTPF
jgi:hypothetical protein